MREVTIYTTVRLAQIVYCYASLTYMRLIIKLKIQGNIWIASTLLNVLTCMQ